jgi:hypothetical protein
VHSCSVVVFAVVSFLPVSIEESESSKTRKGCTRSSSFSIKYSIRSFTFLQFRHIRKRIARVVVVAAAATDGSFSLMIQSEMLAQERAARDQRGNCCVMGNHFAIILAIIPIMVDSFVSWFCGASQRRQRLVDNEKVHLPEM